MPGFDRLHSRTYDGLAVAAEVIVERKEKLRKISATVRLGYTEDDGAEMFEAVHAWPSGHCLKETGCALSGVAVKETDQGQKSNIACGNPRLRWNVLIHENYCSCVRYSTDKNLSAR